MASSALYFVASLAYLSLAVFFWRTHCGADGPHRHAFIYRLVILAPLALHTWLLYIDVFSVPMLRFGFGQALSVTLWLAVTIYWIENFFVRLDGLQCFVLTVAGICVVLPGLFTGFTMQAHGDSLVFRLHLALAMGAYSLFTIASLQALLMAILEKRLHTGALTGAFATLPPLLSLERVLFRIIGIAFVLLTATLVTGFAFSEQVFSRAMRFDHKTIFAITSWVIFAGLLMGRWVYGWRGRTAIRWILAGFVALLLAYVGSRFVLEVILHRGSR
ncbi:MAG: cytochrome C biogenesis protein [Betaproteobacteria bacterium]|nr:cytochrome C biogenesis protein [Betaproteobacteria bacterium]